jgi:hypothetical protein
MGGLSAVAIPDRAAAIQRSPALARRPLLGTDPPSRSASTPPGIGSEAGIVNVRSYVRTVDGKPVTVSYQVPLIRTHAPICAVRWT